MSTLTAKVVDSVSSTGLAEPILSALSLRINGSFRAELGETIQRRHMKTNRKEFSGISTFAGFSLRWVKCRSRIRNILA